MSDVLSWEESLMEDAAGANGGPRTLGEAIDRRRNRAAEMLGSEDRVKWCGSCGAIEIDGTCTDQQCSRSRR